MRPASCYIRCMCASAILNHDAYAHAKSQLPPSKQRQIERGQVKGEPAGRVPTYQPCPKAQVYQKYAGVFGVGGDAPAMIEIEHEVLATTCDCHTQSMDVDDLLVMEFSGVY